MKKVIIDCRYLGMSGIGRFLEGILNNFNFNLYDVTLIGKKDKIEKYPNLKYIYDDSNPYSKTIIKWDKVKDINKCDIYFTPNFVIPYGIKIKCFAVLHDIIFLDMKDINKNFLEYKLKKILLKRCMKKCVHVFTVSKFSQDRISYYFKKYSNKLSYCYNGVESNFRNYNKEVSKGNYIVFVGNIKKHKGLKTLLEAMPLVNNDIKLKIIGDAKNFRNGDKDIINSIDNSNVEFTGWVSDEELLDLVANARYLVQPSSYEGFGLPPLEALYLGTQPIVSDIEVFKEVYSNMPVKFFKLNDSKDLANTINQNPDLISINKEEYNIKFTHKNFIKELDSYFNE